jgi:hypothetical protein
MLSRRRHLTAALLFRVATASAEAIGLLRADSG